MKIGLEFEGVIWSMTTGEITRWSKIDPESRRKIKRLMFSCRPPVEPCDRYDALAEVRTPPIEYPTAEKLVVALFTEMERASHAFSANGYDIQWWEQLMPNAVHEEIRREFNANDPDGKKEKTTYTIVDGKITRYKSEGNLYRGGGLHINISRIPFIFASGLAIELHRSLLGHRKYNFQSHYRNNLLYRTRYELEDDASTYSEIVEYMSHGFNVETLKDWKQEWANATNSGSFPEKFIWARTLMSVLHNFVEGTKGIQ